MNTGWTTGKILEGHASSCPGDARRKTPSESFTRSSEAREAGENSREVSIPLEGHAPSCPGEAHRETPPDCFHAEARSTRRGESEGEAQFVNWRGMLCHALGTPLAKRRRMVFTRSSRAEEGKKSGSGFQTAVILGINLKVKCRGRRSDGFHAETRSTRRKEPANGRTTAAHGNARGDRANGFSVERP